MCRRMLLPLVSRRIGRLKFALVLHYNVVRNQLDRPIGPSRVSRWIGASALAGAVAVHALPLAALLTMGTPPAAALEEAAITVFVEPGGAPVATASEAAGSSQPAAATTREAPPERPLDDAVPSPEPEDARSLPDFRPPAPPPPELRDSLPVPEVREAEAPDFKKQMRDLGDAVPTPEAREAAIPDFRPPAPVPPKPETRPEPRKPTPPPPPQQQRVEPKPAPRAAGPAPAPAPTPAPLPAPSTAPSPHGGFASAAPPASTQPGGAPVVAPGWNALLVAWLAANRRYPEEARRRSVEGEVTVRFSVAADGRVTDVAITAGSGSSALDGAAVAMLRGAKVPPPGTDVTRTVRIRYRLSD